MRGANFTRVILLLLLLSPSIFFASYYLSSSLGPAGATRHYGLTTSDPSFNINLTIRHSPYFVTGQQVLVDLTLRLHLPNPNYTIGVSNVAVELRDPLRINSTSGVVNEWRTLSSLSAKVRQNFTASNVVSKTISMAAIYPPSSSLADSFALSNRVAINGVANLTVYQLAGNTTTATPMIISLLDGQTFYQTQLSTIISSSSWLVYQLLTALVASVIYLRTRPPAAGEMDRSYSLRLEAFRFERSLARLDELLNSGKVNKTTYDELRQSYEKELARVRSSDKTT